MRIFSKIFKYLIQNLQNFLNKTGLNRDPPVTWRERLQYKKTARIFLGQIFQL